MVQIQEQSKLDFVILTQCFNHLFWHPIIQEREFNQYLEMKYRGKLSKQAALSMIIIKNGKNLDSFFFFKEGVFF